MTKKVAPFTIHNIVASFSLDPAPLGLERIHNAFEEESVWDEATFNYGVVVLRVKKPKMSFLIYQTGKVICTGAKSLKSAEQSASYLLNRLREAGFNVRKKMEVKVQNIVATKDLGISLDLEKIVYGMEGVHVIYEPGQFPGAIIRLPVTQNAMATILLFSSGKMVCVGLKRYEDIYEALESLNSKLEDLH